MSDQQPDADVQKQCFNCKAPVQYKLLCNDCWRMLLMANVMGGSLMEAAHNALKMFMAQ